MALLEELRDAFSRARRGSSARSALAPQDALDRLTPALVLSLARFAGQSLSELDATLELLPLGSRLALSRVGAIDLTDQDGEARFPLQVRPFALDLVEGAAERVATAAASALEGELEAELVRIASDRAEADCLYEVDNSKAALASISVTPSADFGKFMGVVKAAALADHLDTGEGIGWLRLLRSCDAESEVTDLKFAYPLKVVAPPLTLTPGGVADVIFTVQVTKGGLRVTPGSISAEALDKLDDTPGTVPVRYKTDRGQRRVSFGVGPSQANGVAQVALVRPKLATG